MVLDLELGLSAASGLDRDHLKYIEDFDSPLSPSL